MASYTASLTWTLDGHEDFPRGRYGRSHTLSFDGGITVPASASPHVVGKWAEVAAVDPEELLVAALSSCHMLSFLHVARDAGFVVTRVVLYPEIEWKGLVPDDATLERLHHQAHEVCFIANSVRTTVTVASSRQAATAAID